MKPEKRLTPIRGVMRWQLDYGVVNGKRKRELAEDETDADNKIKAWDDAQTDANRWWNGHQPDQKLELQAVTTAAAREGFTLEHVWSEFKRLRQSQQVVETPCRYADAVEEWAALKLAAGKGERYIRNGKTTLLKFADGQQQRWIHEFRTKDLEEWFERQGGAENWGLATKETYQSLFSSLWAVATRKKWVAGNIVEGMEQYKRKGAAIKIYSNLQTRLFFAAMMSSPLTQSALIGPVLEAWGCMRPEETTSEKIKIKGKGHTGRGGPEYKSGMVPFGWGDIDLKHGRATVRPEIAKKYDQRTVRLQANAVKWLNYCKEIGCALPPVNERRLIDDACELINFQWERDGWRKCCATHLKNIYKNDHEVKTDMGNSATVLLKNYTALQTPEAESQEYFGIDPDDIKKFMKSQIWKDALKAAENARAAAAKEKAAKEAADKEAEAKKAEAKPSAGKKVAPKRAA